MTPQQRLQEAKDQAAKDAGYNDFIDYKYVLPASVDRFCESLYEAGKKEGDASLLDKACATAQKYQLQAETYRKALEEINELSSCRPNNGDISAISHTALNSKP